MSYTFLSPPPASQVLGFQLCATSLVKDFFFNFTFVYLFVCARTQAVHTDMVHVWRSEGSFGSLLPLWVLEIELGSPVFAVSTLPLSHLAGPDS